jgi:hypothetical protein
VTAAWAKRRARYYATHERRCAACGATERVRLHHRTYRYPLGDEPDGALVPLCARHHAQVHQRAGELDLAVVTDTIIARSRRRWMLLRPLPPWRPGMG